MSLVSKYLSPGQKQELALRLSEDLAAHPENLLAVYELLEEVDNKDDINRNISTYAKTLIAAFEPDNFGRLVDLAERPLILTKVVESVVPRLEAIIGSSILLPGFDQLHKVSHREVDDTHVLDFLHQLLVKTELPENKNVRKLDRALCVLLGHEEYAISNKVAGLLRWRVAALAHHADPLVWDVIFTLAPHHLSHAYVLWLRYLDVAPPSFQDEVQKDRYWLTIRTGLASESHDHRKYALLILQLSVKAIDVSFSSGIFTFDVSRKSHLTKQWQRFTTLYEILAIDTSLHQAQAAADDIVGLIGPESTIHPSWGYVLLATGFKAGMESVRKFSLGVLLSISAEHLRSVKHSLQILEEVFLPSVMLASHFAVRQSESNELTCEFGDKAATFIGALIKNSDDADARAIALSVLRVLVAHKEAYDPARIYVTMGLLQGLEGRQILEFGTHDKPLFELFEASCQGELFETIGQTLNLRLLLHFTYEEAFMEAVLRFVSCNDFKYVIDNKPLIVEYLTNKDVSDASVVLSVLARLMGTETSVGASLLPKVLESGLPLAESETEALTSLFTSVLSGDHPDYESVQNVDFTTYKQSLPVKINLIELWATINKDAQSDQYHVLTALISKYRVFNNILECYAFKDIENNQLFSVGALTTFYKLILVNSDKAARSVTEFYKVKDQIYGQYFRTLAIVSGRRLSEEDVVAVLPLVITTSVNYDVNYHGVRLLHNALESGVVADVEGLVSVVLDLWTNLSASRLQLNQKDLHVLIIQTVLHPVVLEQSHKFSEQLLAFVISVVDNAPGRRCLLPTTTKCLSNFQIMDSEAFEKLEFLPEALTRAFIMQQVTNHPFRLEVILGKEFDTKISLAESNLYAQLYGQDEITARINLMAIFNSIRGPQLARGLLRFITNNKAEFSLADTLRKTNGYDEWRRIQLYSIVVCILDKIDTTETAEYLAQWLEYFDTEPSPLVRLYLEWIIALDCARNDTLFTTVVERLKDGLDNNSCKPTTVTSLERILFLATQQSPSGKKAARFTQLLSMVVPGATSNKAAVRHFSLSLNCLIYPEIKNLSVSPEVVQISENLYNTAVSSDSYGTFRSGDALLWDIKHDLTLVSVTGGVLLRVSDREIDFIRQEDYEAHLSRAQIDLLTHPVGSNLKELWVRERKQQQAKVNSTAKGGSPLQTKSGAWASVMDLDEKRGGDVVRSDLIVVSSLVDKPPNLGGICRLCDVLGAGLLTLNDISVKNNTQFKTVAVTADRWMPMVEVKEPDIKLFLTEKKKDGYTLIGLEQTDKSVQLNSDLKFPRKSLILLGKEKEGIPGELLAELDFCVEIKQVGVIRSMNIQTATAVVVHAYSSQNC